jgi:ribosome-associated protein
MTPPGDPPKRHPSAAPAESDETRAASALRITDEIAIDARELEESFIRASGPGGQNVNKVASAVQLRFDVRRSPSLPAAVKARLARLAGSRLSKAGVLIITAERHRTQARNRADARARLIELIARAAVAPRPRKATAPSAGARRRQREAKARRSTLKRLRASQPEE